MTSSFEYYPCGCSSTIAKTTDDAEIATPLERCVAHALGDAGALLRMAGRKMYDQRMAELEAAYDQRIDRANVLDEERRQIRENGYKNGQEAALRNVQEVVREILDEDFRTGFLTRGMPSMPAKLSALLTREGEEGECGS